MPGNDYFRLRLKQLSVFIVGVAAWEVSAALQWIDPFFFSRPSAVVVRLVKWFSGGSIYPHIGITALETLLAFLAGALLGIIFGFLFARIPSLAAIFDPYVKIANALPRIALAPIFTLWFGLGILSKVVFGVTLVFFIVFFNTYRGVREVNPNILNNARMLGANERDLFRHVLLPSAMSWILASLHTSVGMALVGAVVGEYLGAARGLGYIIAQAEGVFDTTSVFAGLVVLSAFVLIIDLIVSVVESRLLKWKPSA
ncbi:MAG: ABC transporter permease [Deltaproteobacteria bacterium]|nr:ABC transporter permease [Deltaproteobacteria bacterium]